MTANQNLETYKTNVRDGLPAIFDPSNDYTSDLINVINTEPNNYSNQTQIDDYVDGTLRDAFINDAKVALPAQNSGDVDLSEYGYVRSSAVTNLELSSTMNEASTKYNTAVTNHDVALYKIVKENSIQPDDDKALLNFGYDVDYWTTTLKNAANNAAVDSAVQGAESDYNTAVSNRDAFDKAVIACGAFSKRLTDNLDEKIPLDTERGYHVHFKGVDHLLSRPVIFSNRGFGVTPMEQGLRVVGTVEFGGLDNALSKSRIKNLINNAKYMFGDLPEHEDEWLGFRPSLPDFLPVMGPSKNHKNVFYCFGHHHLGWTLGPISGKIISGMIANENTNLDLKPYSSSRFS